MINNDGKKRMKVLHITEGIRWAGMEAHIFNLTSELKKADINIECVAFGKSLFSDRMAQQGVPTFVIKRNRKFDLCLIKKVAQLIRDHGIEIIHMHGYIGILHGLIASFLGGTKSRYVTLHQRRPSLPESGSLKFFLTIKVIYCLAKLFKCKFVAVSEDVKRSWVETEKLDSCNIKIIYNGIDIKNYDRPRVSKASEIEKSINKSSVVSIIGRLAEVKGHKYFIEAAKYILDSKKDIVFLIIGDGPLMDILKEKVQGLGISNEVKFLGFQDNVQNYLLITDVMVISSLYEGIPYNLLEAMCIGVPTVAFRTSGIIEVIESNVDGILVKSKDCKGIAESVLRLLDNNTVREEIILNAQEKVRNNFSAERMAAESILFYKENCAARK